MFNSCMFRLLILGKRITLFLPKMKPKSISYMNESRAYAYNVSIFLLPYLHHSLLHLNEELFHDV